MDWWRGIQSLCLLEYVIFDSYGRNHWQIYRCVLGLRPAEERARLTEKFGRTVSEPRAFKCVLKLRTSTSLDIVEDGILGTLCEDPTMKGVYHIASCAPTSTISAQFGVKEVDEQDKNESDHFYIQVRMLLLYTETKSTMILIFSSFFFL